ncbi:MAG: hypothetical protein ABI835_09910, partial [Chloroflexota bacterium]
AVASLPLEQRMDNSRLSATLDHLTRDHWLTRQSVGQSLFYRVNPLPRMIRRNDAIWDSLELDSIDQSQSLRRCWQLGQTLLPLTSGGKRALPANIWDRLG